MHESDRWIVLILLYCIFVSALFGHAILLSATPAPEQVVKGPDVAIRLRFNSRIDMGRSRVTLIGSDGGQTTLVINKHAPVDTIGSEAKGLKRGFYSLRWQVLANDGHITRGEVRFHVE